MLSAVVDIVLSSAKLKRSDNFNVETRSLRNILNNVGPNIDPCGTPDSNVRKSLKKIVNLYFLFPTFKIRVDESNCFLTEVVGV